MVNSGLVERSEEMVTEPFVAVSIACCVAVDPTVTLPKFSAVGLSPSRGFAFATPFPVTLISTWESVPLFMSVSTPSAYPNALGVKMTGNRTFAPGAISAGKGKSPTVKALPRTEMEAITSVLLPVFASWKENELVSPIWTLPNPCRQGLHCNCWAQAGAVTNPHNKKAITNRGRRRMN
jgi:hypothetical protein